MTKCWVLVWSEMSGRKWMRYFDEGELKTKVKQLKDAECEHLVFDQNDNISSQF